jgi:myosin heavy subunit
VPTPEVARTVGTAAGVLTGAKHGTDLYDTFLGKSDLEKAREESDRARRRRKQWQGESVFRQISDQLRGMFTRDDDIYALLKKAEQRERESKQAKLEELKKFEEDISEREKRLEEDISERQKRLKYERRQVRGFAGMKSLPSTATTSTATQTSTRLSPSKNDTLSRIQNLRNRILQSRSPTRMLTDRDRAMIETRRKSPPMMSSSRMLTLMDRDRDRDRNRDRDRDRERDRAMIETRRKSPPMMSSSRMLTLMDRERDRAMIETRRKSPPMMSSSSSRPQSPGCEEICFSRCQKRRSPERRVRFSDDA